MTTSVSGQKSLGPRSNLVGQKFGRLTVIKLGDKLKNSKYRWFCQLSISKFKEHIFKLCMNNIKEFEIYKEGV